MNQSSTSDDIKARAALYLLKRGIATVGEVATLQGWSRQRLHKITRAIEPRKKRKQFLQELWIKTINRLS